MIAKTERMRLEEVFLDGAMRVSEKTEHWISGHDEGESYCFDCAEKKVGELRTLNPNEQYCVDGGWGTDGDSTPFCEMCHHRLDNSLTQYGCEAEVEHFLEYGFRAQSPVNCLDMYRVISAGMWEPFDGEDEKDRARFYFKNLYRLCRIILRNHFWIMPNNDYRHMWR